MSSIFLDPNASFVCDSNSLGQTYYNFPHNDWGLAQLAFLTLVYAYILYHASNFIAEGSDLLTLILNPGLVGGLVLPVMGAVPDGAIILFSGLGPRETAQDQLGIGIGTLAGSTIMLLTVPWFLATFAGRVDLVGSPPQARYQTKQGQPKLTKGMPFHRTGVTTTNEIPRAAIIMVMTGCIYMVVQGPAFQYLQNNDVKYVAQRENIWALIGFVMALVAFVLNSWYQVASANAYETQKKKILAYRSVAFQRRIVDLAFLVNEIHDVPINELDFENQGLREISQVERILRHTFDRYDVDESGELDPSEIRAMFATLNIHVDIRDLRALVKEMDSNNDGSISFDEYKDATIRWLMTNDESIISSPGNPHLNRSESVLSRLERKFTRSTSTGSYGTLSSPRIYKVPEYLEDYDEDDELGESSMTTRQIICVAGRKLLLGLLLVTLFSDPMCDVLTQLATRLGVSNFYVSFFITPMSSNASELISAIYFGRKRTKSSISLSYAALLGAATMNNTFCLSIFMGIVYFRQLEWNYSAEVLATLLVELIVCVLCLKKTMSIPRATFILALFPLSVLLIASLNYAGWK